MKQPPKLPVFDIMSQSKLVIRKQAQGTYFDFQSKTDFPIVHQDLFQIASRDLISDLLPDIFVTSVKTRGIFANSVKPNFLDPELNLKIQDSGIKIINSGHPKNAINKNFEINFSLEKLKLKINPESNNMVMADENLILKINPESNNAVTVNDTESNNVATVDDTKYPPAVDESLYPSKDSAGNNFTYPPAVNESLQPSSRPRNKHCTRKQHSLRHRCSDRMSSISDNDEIVEGGDFKLKLHKPTSIPWNSTTEGITFAQCESALQDSVNGDNFFDALEDVDSSDVIFFVNIGDITIGSDEPHTPFVDPNQSTSANHG